MFNFTTQTVYNAIVTSGAGQNMWVSDGAKPALRIGNTRFDIADILDIQVKNPSDEALASIEFNMSDVLLDSEGTVNETTARVVLYVGLSMNSQDSFYANDLVYKGKPLFIEFPVKKGDSASDVAKRVVAIAKKYFLFTAQEKILDVTEESGKVKFEGVNGYQQLKAAKLQVFDPEAKTVDCCTYAGEYVDVKVGVPVIYTISDGAVVASTNKLNSEGKEEALASNEVAILPGLEAFGDYNWIIHNLRLPTAANTGFWAPTKGEMPVPGAKYVQIIIRLCKVRDGIMGEIVGARGTSVTTHVLYVEESQASTVTSALTSLGATLLTDADDKLEDPFGDTGDESGSYEG